MHRAMCMPGAMGMDCVERLCMVLLKKRTRAKHTHTLAWRGRTTYVMIAYVVVCPGKSQV